LSYSEEYLHRFASCNTTAIRNVASHIVLISHDPDQYYRALYAAWKAWKRGKVDAARERESTERLARYWKQRAAKGGHRGAPLQGAAL
jgi:hypothetical protein